MLSEKNHIVNVKSLSRTLNFQLLNKESNREMGQSDC